jgi:hypothetical protein
VKTQTYVYVLFHLIVVHTLNDENNHHAISYTQTRSICRVCQRSSVVLSPFQEKKSCSGAVSLILLNHSLDYCFVRQRFVLAWYSVSIDVDCKTNHGRVIQVQQSDNNSLSLECTKYLQTSPSDMPLIPVHSRLQRPSEFCEIRAFSPSSNRLTAFDTQGTMKWDDRVFREV